MRKTIILSLMVLSSSAYSDYASSVDSDGCWDALNEKGDECVVVDRTKWDDTKFRVYYKNTCAHRVYARMCNGRKEGNPDCGSSGIQPGDTKQYYTYKASGEYTFITVGAVKPSSDWVCAGRVPNWND